MLEELNRKDKIERQSEKEQADWEIFEMFEELELDQEMQGEEQESLVKKYSKLLSEESQNNLDDIQDMIDELAMDEDDYNQDLKDDYAELD